MLLSAVKIVAFCFRDGRWRWQHCSDGAVKQRVETTDEATTVEESVGALVGEPVDSMKIVNPLQQYEDC